MNITSTSSKPRCPCPICLDRLEKAMSQKQKRKNGFVHNFCKDTRFDCKICLHSILLSIRSPVLIEISQKYAIAAQKKSCQTSPPSAGTPFFRGLPLPTAQVEGEFERFRL